MRPQVDIRPHSPGDYGALIRLWRSEPPGTIGLSSADEPEQLCRFLSRNEGLSLGLWAQNQLVGSVLTGSDGRRGYLHHLVVAAEYRRRGFGRILVERSLSALAQTGIAKVHVFVYSRNESALAFWLALGFVARDELEMLSREIG